MPSLLEIATSAHQNLGSPDAPTVGVIQYFLRNNIGSFNNLLNTSYAINPVDGTFITEPTDIECDIFHTIYTIYYYETKVRENLGAASIDSVLEVSENGAVVRLTNKNEIAKTYLQLKKQEQENLDGLVAMYRMNNAVPQSVDGDDTTEQWYHGVSVSNTRIKLAT